MSGVGIPMRAAATVAALGGGLPSPSIFRVGATSAEPSVRKNRASIPVSTLSSVQRSSCDSIDEWEYDGEVPRVVFGDAPSFHEAQDATSELKDAVELVYLSSGNSPESRGSSTVGRGVGLASLTNHDCLGTIVSPSLPNRALQAFKFLSETPAAQTVVASVASDPNVWNAVLQNPALVEFMRSCKTNARLPNVDVNSDESIADDVALKSVRILEKLSKLSQPGYPFNDIIEILQNIKLSVLQMVDRVSYLFQDIFGPSVAEKSSDSDGHSQPTFMEKTIGASVIGLAVLVIMVVVLKRN